jgi:peptidoglycan glycosyltransferase
VSVLTFAGYVAVEMARVDSASQFVKALPSTLLYPAAAVLLYFAMHITMRFLAPNADGLLLPLAAALTSVGLVMIDRLGPDLPFASERNSAHVQVIWLLVAAVAFIAVLLFLRNYETLSRYKYSIGLLALLFLAVPMLFGTTVNGAKLWLFIGPLHFQPSEIAKILLVIFLAAFFAEKHELLSISTHRVAGVNVPELKYFVPLIVMWGVSILMMIFQKDLGSSLLFFGIFIVMLYVATGRKSYIFVGFAMFILGAYVCYLLFAHVQVRVVTWLNPFNPATIHKDSYQISQSLFAFSAGGLSGAGLGLGHPTIVPSVTTDAIFAAIGEELGLIGAASVVIMYILFVARGLKVALSQRDDFSKLLAVGLVSVVAIQSFIIMGGITRLIPLTGVTLPFVSYGGSSLLANYILLGLLLVVSQRGASTNVASIKQGRR